MNRSIKTGLKVKWMHISYQLYIFHQLLTEEIEKELREEAVEVLGGNVTGVDDTNLDAAIPDANLPLIYARLTSHTTLTHLKNLKASYYG